MLWETWNGNMMVKVKWFYHPEEIETHGKGIDLKYTVKNLGTVLQKKIDTNYSRSNSKNNVYLVLRTRIIEPVN
jgi:hypothetical protein